MMDLERIARAQLQTEPYRWGTIDALYAPADAADLAATYPFDHFRLVSGYGGEKDYAYDARPLIVMGSEELAFASHLSPAWCSLARTLLSTEYRQAMVDLSGCDLRDALLEVNVFHYGRGAELGPHADLPEKILTHVLYFNETWDSAYGGCLNILRAKDEGEVVCRVPPLLGNSAVLVRADNSWHSVSRVIGESRVSRRSATVTFHRPGSISSMWPPGEQFAFRDYQPPTV